MPKDKRYNKTITMRCKICKREFTPKYFLQKTCMNPACLAEWGKIVYKKENEKKKKDWVKERRPHAYSKEYKKHLQNEVNKLSRMIDTLFNYECIDNCGQPYGKQQDGAHFHSRGSNNSIRYNLHNIHKSRSDCNQHSAEHKPGYIEGLKKRYGEKYYNYVQYDLPLIYDYVKLSPIVVVEKLRIVRKINREFETYVFNNAIHARNMLNKIIGIYNDEFKTE